MQICSIFFKKIIELVVNLMVNNSKLELGIMGNNEYFVNTYQEIY